jgi:hypothetical protein
VVEGVTTKEGFVLISYLKTLLSLRDTLNLLQAMEPHRAPRFRQWGARKSGYVSDSHNFQLHLVLRLLCKSRTTYVQAEVPKIYFCTGPRNVLNLPWSHFTVAIHCAEDLSMTAENCSSIRNKRIQSAM